MVASIKQPTLGSMNGTKGREQMAQPRTVCAGNCIGLIFPQPILKTLVSCDHNSLAWQGSSPDMEAPGPKLSPLYPQGQIHVKCRMMDLRLYEGLDYCNNTGEIEEGVEGIWEAGKGNPRA